MPDRKPVVIQGEVMSKEEVEADNAKHAVRKQLQLELSALGGELVARFVGGNTKAGRALGAAAGKVLVGEGGGLLAGLKRLVEQVTVDTGAAAGGGVKRRR